MIYGGVDNFENTEFHEHCDGCDEPRRASELSKIGDGSIKVCQACYSAATAMVSTRPSLAIPAASPSTVSPVPEYLRRLSPTDKPAVWPFGNPLLALLRFSGISAGADPPVETRNFAREA